MNYWCNTCGCYKGATGADECAVDGHAIVPAKDREVKVSAAKPTIQGAEWISGKVLEKAEGYQKEISELRKTIHEVHGTLDAVIHAADPLQSMKIWLPVAIRHCRKAMGLPVEPIPPLSAAEIEMLKKAGFGVEVPKENPFTKKELEQLENSPFKGPNDPYPKPKEEWIPKVGDRVWVSGKTWSGPGTIIGFAKDDPSVPWIKVDKDGNSWDARDCGSVRKLEEGDSK